MRSSLRKGWKMKDLLVNYFQSYPFALDTSRNIFPNLPKYIAKHKSQVNEIEQWPISLHDIRQWSPCTRVTPSWFRAAFKSFSSKILPSLAGRPSGKDMVYRPGPLTVSIRYGPSILPVKGFRM